MKKTVKAWLHHAGLLPVAQQFYFNAKTASPSVLRREVQYRLDSSPDGFSFPPSSLIFDVIACRWAPVYYDSGKRIVEDMDVLLRRHDIALSTFESILDFGCGCGRLIRHVETRTAAKLHGSDYNPELIAWCKRNLPFGEFFTNELAPPLQYADATFDFIYARSVFTHLPQHLQTQWMRELHRVLKPGGHLYFTMHGRPLVAGLTAEQQESFERGRLVVTYSSLAGENLCSTYASREYVERELLEGFALVDHLEGRDEEHLKQDVYLFRKQR
ncbi:MAG: methyltransferase domain-containing protein [Bacteroidetes bacterium]|jgi:SAM-dependent methyltransferase|nr:methyltransferase domain-containing protein [Bacteroidota bacterium]